MKKILLTLALLVFPALILGCGSGDSANLSKETSASPTAAGVRDPGGGITETGVRDPGGGVTNDQDGVRDPGGGCFLIIVRTARGNLPDFADRRADGTPLEYGTVVGSDTTWGFLSLDNALDELQNQLNEM